MPRASGETARRTAVIGSGVAGLTAAPLRRTGRRHAGVGDEHVGAVRGLRTESAGARGPAGLLARPRNALSGPYLRMLAQVPRFHRAAHRLLTVDADQALTLGESLDREGFSACFRAHFMTPVVSAAWSCDAVSAL